MRRPGFLLCRLQIFSDLADILIADAGKIADLCIQASSRMHQLILRILRILSVILSSCV